MKQKNKESGDKMFVAPSILTNLDSLEPSVKKLEELNVDYLHLDVMDNQFVPNYTFDYHLIKKIRPKSKLFFDTHLMITTAETDYQKYIDAGSDLLTIHYEAVKNQQELVRKIKQAGIKVGISIKPATDIKVLDCLLSEVDVVLVMSVEPGFGGQMFQEQAIEKIKYLNNVRKINNYHYLIEVDGGINLQTAQLVKEAGCDIIVVGSYLMKSKDIDKTYHQLKNI